MTLTRSIVWLFVAEFFFYASGYIVHAGAGRILGPADYGRYGLVITLTVLIANLIGNGIPIAMSKFLSEARAAKPELISAVKRTGARAQMLFLGLVTLIFLGLSGPLASLMGDESLAPLFRISALIIPAYASDSFYFYYYSGIHRFSLQSTLKLMRSFLRVFVILGLAYFFHLRGIIAGYIFVPLLVFLAAWRLDKRERREPLTLEDQKPFPLGKMARLALPVTLFLVLFEVLMSFDLYVVKILFDDDKLVGLYNAALTVARIPSYLFYALTLILLPTISESSAIADTARMRDLVSRALRFIVLITLPFLALAFAYPGAMVELFFGPIFRPAASMLPWLLLGTGLFAIPYVLSFAYKGAGLIRVPLIFLTASLLLNVTLDAWLLPLWGLEGIAVAKAVTAIIVLPVFLLSLQRRFQADMYVFGGLKALLVALVMGWIGYLSGDTVGHLLGIGSGLLVFYFVVAWFSGAILPEDRQIFRKFFKNSLAS